MHEAEASVLCHQRLLLLHCSSALTLKHASQGKCDINVLLLIYNLRGYHGYHRSCSIYSLE